MQHTSETISIILSHKKQIFWMLITVYSITFTLYISFLNIAVFATSNRKQVSDDLNELSAKVSELETRYISFEQHLNLARAEELGLLESTDPIFVSRITPKGLSFNNK